MIDELCRKLKYQFKDPGLLKLALTHRSSHEQNNERLEFLGDSIVNFVIAEALFRKFGKSQEGELSRWRAGLVNREALANVARHFEIGRYLILGPGELKSGGSERQSILSCAMEAIIGAIYLDSDFTTVQACILRWYEPLLQTLTHVQSDKDPKTLLQEYLQADHKPLPVYHVESIEGEAHQQIFTISCQVVGQEKIYGTGTSRRRAEQSAAEAMLQVIKNEK